MKKSRLQLIEAVCWERFGTESDSLWEWLLLLLQTVEQEYQ